jgi:hypothetical protein
MLIGDEAFLIPRRSVLETLSGKESATSSVSTFSGCHEYTAESSLRFDGQDSAGEAKTDSRTITPLPPGLSLTLALVDPVDSDTAAAGDAVLAKVSEAVRAPHSRRILVPADALAHGRILQMRYQYSSQQFLILIRFETLETRGVLTPLSLKLNGELKAEKAWRQNELRNRGTEFSLPSPAPGEAGGLFTTPATNGRYVIPVGFTSKWTTVDR